MASNELTLEYCNETVNPEWDSFVNEMDGDIVQTSTYSNIEAQYNKWQPHRFYVKKNNQLVGVCLIYIVEIRFLGKIGLVPFGP